MIIKLEDKTYTFKANGRFMKKYQEIFNENLILALYKMTTEKDVFTCAKLIYAGIEEEKSFDDWLDSFESPIFALPVMDEIMEYLTRTTEPTVENKVPSNTVKKKKK